MSKPDQLLKIAELMDNLKSENIQFRLIAIKSLGIISDTIGGERTGDENEVLVALAEVLGSMVPQIDRASQGHVLFPILESLCVVEDLSVRQKAVQSLKDPELELKIMAASKLADFAKSLGSLASETVIRVLLPIVHDLAKDDNATFKEALTNNVLGLSGLLSKADCTTHTLPFLLDFLSDKQKVEVRTAAISNLERVAKGIELEQVAPRFLATVTTPIHAVQYEAWMDTAWKSLRMRRNRR